MKPQASAPKTAQPSSKRSTMANTGQQIFDSMVTEFATNAFVTKDNEMELGLQSDSDSFESDLTNGLGMPKKPRKSKKDKQLQQRMKNGSGNPRVNRDEIEMGNIFTSDKNKMELLLNLNSLKLLEISDKFDLYPDEQVTCDEFIDIMASALKESIVCDRDDFLNQLVDLFYRCKKSTSKQLKFEQLTAHLIDHEIEQSQTGHNSNVDMRYVESDTVKDRSKHNNNIEKIFYFQQIDRVVLYEQNNKSVRFYDAKTMKWQKDILCTGVILAIEYCPAQNAIAVSLSNRMIVFFDAVNQNNKIVRRMYVPSTQKCLTYVQREHKNLLFSAGVDGAIFAWNLDILFSNEFAERQEDVIQDDTHKKKGSGEENKEKLKKEYINFICERTPWFVGDIILCIIDLKNINQLASGSYDHKIRLWDLRPTTQKRGTEDGGRRSKKQESIEKYFGQKHLSEELLEDFTKQPVKVLQGHNKAVREMAYSEKHKIIVSCGFDFEVFIWNPYLEERIMKLDGHEQPLVGVNCLSSLNCFITADSKGTVKVWSILDYSCIQTFYVQNVSQVTCIRAVPKHRQLICGSRQFKVFQYQKPFMQEFSDDNPITCAKFSQTRLEIYVAGERSIKIWDARTGKPVRVIKNVLDRDITYMELDTDHRKLLVGSHQGEVKIFDLISGINTLTLDQHDPQEGEISYIGYAGTDYTVITTGWDKVIKVHMDEKDHSQPQERFTSSETVLQMDPAKVDIQGLMERELQDQRKQKLEKENSNPQNSKGDRNFGRSKPADKTEKFENPGNLLRGRADAHKNSIICGDFAHHLDLIATGGRDNKARVWDYERIMNVGETPDNYHKDEVTMVKFIKPFPLLITSDSNGLLYIWLTKPHPQAGKLIVDWRNNYTLQQNCPITAIDTFYDERQNKLLMLIGDEMGTVRVQDLSEILRQKQIIIKPESTVNKKRNPYRIVELAQSSQTKGDQEQEQYEPDQSLKTAKDEAVIKEAQVVQIAQWQPHTDVIKSIQYIEMTDEPLVFTASRDKFVKIFTLLGEERGCLLQGYMMLKDYKWDFPMTTYDDQQSERQTCVSQMINTMKAQEANEKRKAKVDQQRKDQKQTSYQVQPLKNAGTSSLQDFSGRTMKTQSVMKLLERGQEMVEIERYRENQRLLAQKPQTSGCFRRHKTSFADFKNKQQMSRMQAKEERDRKIGPFKFDYDDDIESEVLYSEQVQKDLKEREDILGKTAKQSFGGSQYK